MGKTKLLLFEADARCLSKTKSDAACNNTPREADRISATRLIHKHYGQQSRMESDVGGDLINLLCCGIHQEEDTTRPPDLTILLQYLSRFTDWARANSPLPEIEIKPSTAGSRTSVGDKLKEPINDKESADGQTYIFTCLDLPGLVKIGYVKGADDALEDRRKKWGKCHSRPKMAFRAQTIFPHRVEELVHRELAEWRRDVGCPLSSCKSKFHSEWFECGDKEAEEIMTKWIALMKEHALYGSDSRQLASSWKNTVEVWLKREVDLSAKILLDTRGDEGGARGDTEAPLIHEKVASLRLDEV